MLISSFSFTIMNTIVKYLSHIPPFQLVFFRSIGSMLIASTYLLRYKIPPLGNNRRLLLIRGILGCIAMSLFFISLKYLSLGTAVSLRYLSPIFAAFFAVLFLKETIKPKQWVFFTIAFLGVLILKGFDLSTNTLGLIIILSASVFSGMIYVIIRKIGVTENPIVVVNYFMVIATIIGGIVSIFNWIPPKKTEWLLLGSLGLFGYFGQLYMTKAFQIAKTNLVSPLKYIEAILAILISILWFGDIYTYWSFMGIAMIIAGLLLNVFYSSK